MRIQNCFNKLSQDNASAFIPYIMAGDPNINDTLDWMHTLKSAGADLIELGVPFSDPMADGPVIQLAGERALAQHVGLANVIEIVRAFRKDDQTLPIILMTYLNPIEQMGINAFCQQAQDAGVDGVLIVDLPLEEAQYMLAEFEQYQLTMIFLLSLTTNQQRLKEIASMAKGFIYCISLKGITGASHLDDTAVRQSIANIKQYTNTPIAVGFGIHNADTAGNMAQLADAVVVGSAVVSIIADNGDKKDKCKEELYKFIHQLNTAVKLKS